MGKRALLYFHREPLQDNDDHSILYTLYSILYTFTESLFGIMMITLDTLYSIHYTLYSILYTLYFHRDPLLDNDDHSRYSILHTLYSLFYTLYSILSQRGSSWQNDDHIFWRRMQKSIFCYKGKPASFSTFFWKTFIAKNFQYNGKLPSSTKVDYLSSFVCSVALCILFRGRVAGPF